MHYFAFLMFFAIGVALLAMLFLLFINIIMAVRVFFGHGVSVVPIVRYEDKRFTDLESQMRELKTSVERQRNDDWVRDHNNKKV